MLINIIIILLKLKKKTLLFSLYVYKLVDLIIYAWTSYKNILKLTLKNLLLRMKLVKISLLANSENIQRFLRQCRTTFIEVNKWSAFEYWFICRHLCQNRIYLNFLVVSYKIILM